jgi:hypothetical protein
MQKASNTTRTRNTSRIAKVISHRATSRAAKVHLYVRANRERPRSEVVEEMKRRFKLTDSTARNWFQTYKNALPDITPSAQH